MNFKVPYLRWLVAFALFMAALLNYVDRNVLGLLATTIQKDLNISNREYAGIINSFLIAYTLANLLSGRVVDKLGVRWSLALFVAWWTLANGLTGLARSLREFVRCAFCWGWARPVATPPHPRRWPSGSRHRAGHGRGNLQFRRRGRCNHCAGDGGILPARGQLGWRWVFAVTPVVAALWMLLWLWLYKSPAAHPHMTEKEKNHLAANLDHASAAAVPGESERALWGRVLREPLVWMLMLARLITDPAWYFFQFWFPKYLRDVRGLDQKGVAIMWMIFAAATVGFTLGGFLSGRLVKRGLLPSAARVWIMLGSACLAPLMGWVPAAPTATLAVVAAMVVACAATAWLSNITSLVVDLVPQRILGTAFGVIACGSALGGFFMNRAVAWFIDHRSYNGCFYVMAGLYPLAWLLVWPLRKRANAN